MAMLPRDVMNCCYWRARAVDAARVHLLTFPHYRSLARQGSCCTSCCKESSLLIAKPSANIARASKTGEGFIEANTSFHVRAFISLVCSTTEPLAKIELRGLRERRPASARLRLRSEAVRRGEAVHSAVCSDPALIARPPRLRLADLQVPEGRAAPALRPGPNISARAPACLHQTGRPPPALSRRAFRSAGCRAASNPLGSCG